MYRTRVDVDLAKKVIQIYIHKTKRCCCMYRRHAYSTFVWRYCDVRLHREVKKSL